MTLMTLAAFLATLDAEPIVLMEEAFVTSPEYHSSVIHPISKNMVAVDITSNQK